MCARATKFLLLSADQFVSKLKDIYASCLNDKINKIIIKAKRKKKQIDLKWSARRHEVEITNKSNWIDIGIG